MQRVSASGNPLWTSNGVAICTQANQQYSPVIESDGAGGAIIAWYDARSGNDDMYAQRVNAAGAVQWTANGVALCTAAGSQQRPRIVSDGAGGAIVAWHDYRNGNDLDVYAQRINASGVVQWTVNGVPLTTAAASQSNPIAVSDGAGGVIVAWEDRRSGSNLDIYVQRVDINGSASWTANGVALCTNTDDQLDPVIAGDGAGGAIVAWRDLRGTYDNVYAQRINAAGTVQWTANGVAARASAYFQANPQIASDGAGGAIICWQENRSTFDVYGQRLSASGAGLWGSGGVALSTGLGSINDLYGCPDGSGGMIASWYESIGGSYDVFAQRVSVSGALPWGSAKTPVCTAIDNQMYPSPAPDGTGGAIVAWHDYRSGDVNIYAQLVDAAGRAAWLAPDIAAVHDVPGDQGGQVFLSWDAARADRFMDAAMSHYSIWRSIDAGQAALAVEKGASEIGSLAELDASAPLGVDPVIRVEETGTLTIYWQLVGTHDALYMEGYGSPVATLFDSSAACSDPHYFQVVAHTTNPQVFWKSDAASGWSVDNLAPCPPVGFVGERSVAPFGLDLTWEPNTEGDFSCYALYRGLSTGFVPGAGNLVGRLDETEYFDGEWNWGAGYFYKLSAFDINGNESAFSLFSTDNITGDETPAAPGASYLAQNFPNPFNPTTRIAFGLAAPANVSLRIYDAAGRLVRVLAEGARPAGNYSEFWDGRDSRGAAVASGIYFYRLTAGTFTETRKMALLR